MNKTKTEMARILENMDNVIRLVNDEENGIFESWLANHVPDGDGFKDFMEYDDQILEELYTSSIEFFAEHISELIANGDFNDRGRTLEFFNPNSVR